MCSNPKCPDYDTDEAHEEMHRKTTGKIILAELAVLLGVCQEGGPTPTRQEDDDVEELTEEDIETIPPPAYLGGHSRWND